MNEQGHNQQEEGAEQSHLVAELTKTLLKNAPEIALMFTAAHLVNVTPDVPATAMLEGILALSYLTIKVFMDEIRGQKEFNWGHVGKVLTVFALGTGMGLLYRAGITEGHAAEMAKSVVDGIGNVARGVLEGGANVVGGVIDAPSDIAEGIQEITTGQPEQTPETLSNIKDGIFWVMTGAGTVGTAKARQRWLDGAPGRNDKWQKAKSVASNVWDATGGRVQRGYQRIQQFRSDYEIKPQIFAKRTESSDN
jgi:hypothetical protein